MTTYPRVPGLDWKHVPDGLTGPEWHLVRGAQVVAIIIRPDPHGMYQGAYLGETREYVLLHSAKYWLRGEVARAVGRWGSIEQAEAAHLKQEVAVARRKSLVMGGPLLGGVYAMDLPGYPPQPTKAEQRTGRRK